MWMSEAFLLNSRIQKEFLQVSVLVLRDRTTKEVFTRIINVSLNKMLKHCVISAKMLKVVQRQPLHY